MKAGTPKEHKKTKRMQHGGARAGKHPVFGGGGECYGRWRRIKQVERVVEVHLR